MSPAQSVAANLASDARQKLAIEVLAKSQPISQLAATHQVSRKFLYEQGQKAKTAMDATSEPTASDDDVLFHLPVTKTWLSQLILGLVLICHSSYRGVVELFRDLLDVSISVGTIHNRLQSAAATASGINQAQDLARIQVGLHDEIFQGSQPVLAGVDAASTYCYLLQGVEHRDGETWGWHLLDVMEQGFQPDFTIADGGAGLRAGQKEVLPDIPCHGDVFHLQQQFETVVNLLNRQAPGATSKRLKLEQKLAQARLKGQKTRSLHGKLNAAHQREQQLVLLFSLMSKPCCSGCRMMSWNSRDPYWRFAKTCLTSSSPNSNSGNAKHILGFRRSANPYTISGIKSSRLRVCSTENSRRLPWTLRCRYRPCARFACSIANRPPQVPTGSGGINYTFSYRGNSTRCWKQ